MIRNFAAMEKKEERVAFGGGCFWCTEAVFLQLRGVCEVTPGYAGGHVAHPTYEMVCAGATGHAEVILILYDPDIISFRKLLDVFFASHDPTAINRQGADVGTQYRSIILTTTEEQKKEAEGVIRVLNASKKYAAPIATQIVPLADTFFPAEEYHRRYYERHPDAGYSQSVIAPKVEKVRRSHPDMLKDDKG